MKTNEPQNYGRKKLKDYIAKTREVLDCLSNYRTKRSEQENIANTLHRHITSNK
jgi:hypothetical protein